MISSVREKACYLGWMSPKIEPSSWNILSHPDYQKFAPWKPGGFMGLVQLSERQVFALADGSVISAFSGHENN